MQSQGGGTAVRNAALAEDFFKEPNHEHFEEHGRIDGSAPSPNRALMIKGGANVMHCLGEVHLPQHDIEPIIERVARSADNLLRWHPQIELLNFAVFALEF